MPFFSVVGAISSFLKDLKARCQSLLVLPVHDSRGCCKIAWAPGVTDVVCKVAETCGVTLCEPNDERLKMFSSQLVTEVDMEDCPVTVLDGVPEMLAESSIWKMLRAGGVRWQYLAQTVAVHIQRFPSEIVVFLESPPAVTGAVLQRQEHPATHVRFDVDAIGDNAWLSSIRVALTDLAIVRPGIEIWISPVRFVSRMLSINTHVPIRYMCMCTVLRVSTISYE
eukprot:GHVU01133305.1.p1 GENE.GHVU01133305.1~~GHVU01133305.1.p1  ORF type:complete len:224 (+),score=8.65 GHVU01133305.1:72-743(+)